MGESLGRKLGLLVAQGVIPPAFLGFGPIIDPEEGPAASTKPRATWPS